MNTNLPRAAFTTPVPEIPVQDVERAQAYYHDVLGFEIAWLEPDKSIGAVLRSPVTIFLRRREAPFEPAINWIFTADVDAAYEEMKSAGANIVEPLELKPWGIRQFRIDDSDGNRFYIHAG